MSGNVVDLKSRRLARDAKRECPGCLPNQLCYPHRLEALASRLRTAKTGVLLIPVDALDDALDVIDGITRECLPAHARTPNNPNNSDRRVK
jgi:hypothetical protein